jgi:hypothetical protein
MNSRTRKKSKPRRLVRLNAESERTVALATSFAWSICTVRYRRQPAYQYRAGTIVGEMSFGDCRSKQKGYANAREGNLNNQASS